ncbi:MAG: GNAT family N-acetyltransferase [Chitinophagales bacterium]|nr:GNAT family N-acetyltransferase [Bacteroidota bacterium]MCB9043329.1 GNAT family N-acetyltransferase [Chitinophagales bacterium]
MISITNKLQIDLTKLSVHEVNTPEDRADLIALRKIIAAENDFDFLDVSDVESYYQKRENVYRKCFFLLRNNEKACGIGEIIPINTLYCHHIAEANILLMQSVMGQGCASLLMQHIEKKLIKLDISKAQTTILQNNLQGLSFLIKHGFHIEGKLKGVVYKNEEFFDAYFMAKNI